MTTSRKRNKVNMSGWCFPNWLAELGNMLEKWYNIDINSMETFNAKKVWQSGVNPEEAVMIAVGAKPSIWDSFPDVEEYFTDDYVMEEDQTR